MMPHAQVVPVQALLIAIAFAKPQPRQHESCMTHTVRTPQPALAGEKIFEEYKTEYSTDKIEMHVGAIQPGQRVVLVDDLIATGGTLGAGINLVSECRGRGRVLSCGWVGKVATEVCGGARAGEVGFGGGWGGHPALTNKQNEQRGREVPWLVDDRRQAASVHEAWKVRHRMRALQTGLHAGPGADALRARCCGCCAPSTADAQRRLVASSWRRHASSSCPSSRGETRSPARRCSCWWRRRASSCNGGARAA